ncbi:response regulator [Kiritimatiellota bacterium B12222]|nr:response regulator [Kiritimatiellota bacterium B12222]
MNLNRTILIVDDEAPIRKLSQRLLKRNHYETMEAANGNEALSQYESNPEQVDGVLLDLNLPDGTGEEWAEKFREIKPDIPIIYFTGSNPPACRGGVSRSYYLKKPFTPASVSELLQEVFPETV